ncbi:MAG: acetyl-CoA C-acyltransferase [Alphaproteobacteria bacterium]|nr:acetyl-CoA C-acyltransferase [Alphaproteobacteria bacterium]
MQDAFIYQALRTPRAKARAEGSLKGIYPEDLVAGLLREIARRECVDLDQHLSRLTLGCVGQVGAQGGQIAHLAKASAGLNGNVTTRTLNNYCVSGLSAIGDTAMAVRGGEDGLMLAGGVEMLSRVPFMADSAPVYTDPERADRLNWLAPILGAELLATEAGFTKQDVDDITARSHRKAAAAWQAGHYDTSVVPVVSEAGEVLCGRDEWVKGDMSVEALSRRAPAFAELGKAGGEAIMLRHKPELGEISYVHSVSNTPGLSDAAALVLMGGKAAGDAAGLTPRARVVAYAEATSHPVDQFRGGFMAMEEVLRRAGLSIDDLDLIEFMEAFAAPPLFFERTYRPDMDRVNVNGGHLAMGHPMGATGAILTTTLLHELERRDAKCGMVVTLAGGGVGAALVIERV